MKYTVSKEDHELLNKMNQQPHIKATVRGILAIAQSECDGCQTAAQAEDAITDALRSLGSEVMNGWANGMETRVARKVKEEHPEYQLREKKTLNGTQNTER
jgi:hypothetical protein